ncbi:MAG: type II secretion system protein GspN [Deltaproteobacteria bacterium]|nr:type II secretion system protein GspN [Deltaproteobacteria bacterium]
MNKDVLKRWPMVIGFVLFGLGLFVVLVYYRFPYNRLTAYLLDQVNEDGRINVTVESLKPTRPINFVLKKTVIQLPVGKTLVPLFEPRDIDVQVGLWPLLTRRLNVSFSSKIFSGNISGQINTDLAFRDLSARVDSRGMDLSQCPYLQAAADIGVTGKLSGGGTYRGTQDWLTGTGKVQLSLEDGVLTRLSRLQIPLDTVPYKNIKAALALDKGRIVVSDFSIKSDQLTAEASGIILPAQPLINSSLDLKVTLVMGPASPAPGSGPGRAPGGLRMVMLIKGTLHSPQVQMQHK